MTTTRSSLDAMVRAVDVGVFDPPRARVRDQISQALRRLWRDIVTLPDRGHEAGADELPPEFYRFAPF
jgi:hypothetical protein